jgi:hypothetical protein
MNCVDIIDLVFGIFNEGSRPLQPAAIVVPIACVCVFDHVNPFGAYKIIEQLKSRDHVFVDVTPVVKDDVYLWVFRQNLFDNGRIILTANKDFDRILLMLLAFGIDVKANNACPASEVLSPHLERAAPKNADLKHDWRCIAESREMFFIDIEIMKPFVKSLGGILQKVSVEKALVVLSFHEGIEGRPEGL